MTRAGAELGAWIVGGVGMLGCAIGGALAPAQFPYAWLAAVTGWIGWPLGSLALILIHALIGGRWGLAIRPHLIAGIVTLPLLMPVLLPLLFVLHALYPWMHADVAAHLDNRFYLNAAFFYGRGVVYLTVWFGLAALVLRALCHENPEAILYRIAPPGLILLALTVTFAAFDYTLSMEPRFKSSIYGLLVGAGRRAVGAFGGRAGRDACTTQPSAARRSRASGSCCSDCWCSGHIWTLCSC